jgi:hypothetical protein
MTFRTSHRRNGRTIFISSSQHSITHAIALSLQIRSIPCLAMDIIPRIMTSASADHPFLSHPLYRLLTYAQTDQSLDRSFGRTPDHQRERHRFSKGSFSLGYSHYQEQLRGFLGSSSCRSCCMYSIPSLYVSISHIVQVRSLLLCTYRRSLRFGSRSHFHPVA